MATFFYSIHGGHLKQSDHFTVFTHILKILLDKFGETWVCLKMHENEVYHGIPQNVILNRDNHAKHLFFKTKQNDLQIMTFKNYCTVFITSLFFTPHLVG